MGALLSKVKPSSKKASSIPEKMSTTATETVTTTSTPLAFSHYAKAQTTFQPPLIANENAFLGDVFASTDAGKPVACGFYRLEKGTPLVYTYTYHEMKIIVDGEFDISDETGQSVHAVKGDVFYFPKGSVITFKTDSFGLAFYTGQRVKDAA